MVKSELTKVMRGIAVFEAAKGIVVLSAGLGLISLLRSGNTLNNFIQQWINHMHLKSLTHTPDALIELTKNITNSHLWSISGFISAYALLRFTEAYGLWQERRWAEWLAALSSGIYLPIEIVELSKGINLWRTATFILNCLIILFMVYALYRKKGIE